MSQTRTRGQSRRTSGTHLWLVLMKVYRSLRRVAVESIEASGVGLSDFGVLELLLHKGPQPVNEIGRRIDLTSGAITTAVDRLESRGLVARESHPTDRRTRMVRLTSEGQHHAAALFARHSAAMDALFEGLTAPERTALVQLLKKLGAAADLTVATSHLVEEEDHVRTSDVGRPPR